MYMKVLVVQLWRLRPLLFENDFELWYSWRDDLEVFDWSKGFRFMIGYMTERYDKGSWSENRDLLLSWSQKVIEDNSFTQFWHYGKIRFDVWWERYDVHMSVLRCLPILVSSVWRKKFERIIGRNRATSMTTPFRSDEFRASVISAEKVENRSKIFYLIL